MNQPDQYRIKDNGVFPGNELPVLHYKKVLRLPWFFPSRYARKIMESHGWTNTWRNGIYTYDHYHSNTHEAMAVISGHTTLLLGGENGTQLTLQKGDVIVLPAGVAHRNRGRMKDVICVGAYPEGKDFDMNYGHAGERPTADKNIAAVTVPAKGPLYGKADPLIAIWKNHKKPVQNLYRKRS